jgi:hypothetical protein
VPQRKVLVPFKGMRLRHIKLYMGLPAMIHVFSAQCGGKA